MKRRVVITGLGAITPIGNNIDSFWEGIKLGKNGIDEISLFNAENLKVKMAAEVKDFDPSNYIWIEKNLKEWIDILNLL